MDKDQRQESINGNVMDVGYWVESHTFMINFVDGCKCQHDIHSKVQTVHILHCFPTGS